MYTLGHLLLSMQYAFVPHTFINSIYAIFYYIAMIPYANSVNASLQYANSVIATLPLCQLSTCHETLWWTYNMTVLRLLQNRRAISPKRQEIGIKFTMMFRCSFYVFLILLLLYSVHESQIKYSKESICNLDLKVCNFYSIYSSWWFLAKKLKLHFCKIFQMFKYFI